MSEKEGVFFESRRVAVVGNGPSVLNSGQGEFIESHDVVVRFNNFEVEGYQKDCGSRTDVWVRNHMPYSDIHRRSIENFSLVLYHPMQGKTKKYFLRDCKREVGSRGSPWVIQIPWESVKAMRRRFPKKAPTMGLIFLHYLFGFQTAEPVSVLGFDFMQERGPLHYFEKKWTRKGRHWQGQEKRVLGEWVEAGKVAPY